jgi:hypothetical protein
VTALPSMSGARDFDFLLGGWTVRNRKLTHPLEPDSSDWAEFISHVTNCSVLGGLGNLDAYVIEETPAQPGLQALALRLFDPSSGQWRIWWASTLTDGQLDTPVVGGFHGDHGVFECEDILGGQAVTVRYEWLVRSGRPQWKQSFSFDRGQTFAPNWIMDWRRV